MAEAVEQSDHSKVRKWLEKKASSLWTQTLNGADAEMQTWLIYFAIHHLNSCPSVSLLTLKNRAFVLALGLSAP